MKQLTLILTIIAFMISGNAKAQLDVDTNAILTAYLESEYIFEGVVMEQCTFRDPANGNIYTSNTIAISKIIKGSLSCGTVNIITLGGEHNDENLSISHGIEFVPGVLGVFVCKNSNYQDDFTCPLGSNPNNLMLTFAYNGSIEYLFDMVNAEVIGFNSTFPTLDSFYDFLSSIGINIIYCNGSLIENKRALAKLEVNNPILSYPERVKNNEIESKISKHLDRTKGLNVTNLKKAGEEIEFQITNATIVNNKYKVDISVRSNVNTTYLESVAFRLKYNKAATGANIDSLTTLQLGNDFSGSFYDVVDASNFKDSILTISIFNSTLSSPQRTQLTTIFKKLVTITIPLANCKQFGNFKIDTFSIFNLYTQFMNSSTTPWSPNNSYTYDKRVFGSSLQGEQCTPDILSINKYNVVGGVKEQVTINGSNFGNTKGQIFLKNVDTDDNPSNLQNGPKYIPIDQIDILSWSNTQINIYVPSVVDSAWFKGGAYTRRIAGTGYVRVKDATGLISQDISSNSIYVNYSIFNERKTNVGTPYKQTQLLFSSNTDGKYHFKLNSNITNSNMINCINAAFRKWSCNTGVNFVLDIGTVSTGIADDGYNIIKIGGAANDSSYLARTFSRGVLACSNNTSQPYSTKEIDIEINQYFLNSFQYDTTGAANINSGLYDFFSIILHEIGHGHLFHHVGDQSDIMYYASSKGPANASSRKLNFNSNNLAAGDYVVSKSSNQNYGLTCAYNLPLIPAIKYCRTTGLNSISQSDGSIEIFPNPFVNNFQIKVDATIEDNLKINIYDLIGQCIYSDKVKINTGETTIPISLTNINSMMYFISIEGQSFKYNAKLSCTK